MTDKFLSPLPNPIVALGKKPYGIGTAASAFLLGKYLLATNGNDSLSADVLSDTRSTVKNFLTDASTFSTVAANIAAYTGGGFLGEAASENVFVRSQEYDSASWLKYEGVVSGTTTDPDGGSDSHLFIPSTNSDLHLTYQSVSLTSGQDHAESVFVKKGGYNGLMMTIGLTGTNPEIEFDLNLGTVTSETAGTGKITAAPNGHWRCEMSFTSDVTGAKNATYRVLNNSGDSTFVGDGVSGVYFYGGQFEDGTAASSYIQTTTVPVTRTADYPATVAVQLPTNDATIYLKTTFTGHTGGNDVVFDARSDVNNGVYLVIGASTAQLIKMVAGATNTAAISLTPVNGTEYEIKCEYGAGGMELDIDGTTGAGANTDATTNGANIYLNSSTAGIQQSYQKLNTLKPATGTGYTMEEMRNA